MSRIRSPGYPSISLPEAIVIVSKIWNSVRQNTVDREAAVKDMGYSGLTGQSSKMLSNLSHFGLVEKSGKGGIRVTDDAKKILYSNSSEERREALNKTAYSPELFAQIKEKFPDGYVSENALRNYLMREGFSGVAVAPAMTSYLETYDFLRQENAIESHVNSTQPGPESSGRVETVDRAHPVRLVDLVERPSVETPTVGVKVMTGERVVFVEESGPDQYLKLIAAGPMDESLLEALEDYVKRQKKRLSAPVKLPPPPGDAEYRARRAAELLRRADASEDDEAAN
jgi:hypothetical protein